MKIELERLQFLVSQACQHIYETEMEIKYVEGLEVQRVNKARILKAVCTKQQDLEHQLRRCQTTVENPFVIADEIDKSDKKVMI